jgi:hypothetical protein
VDALGAPHVGERTEKQLIGAFCDKIAELQAAARDVQWQQLRPGRLAVLCHDPRVSAPGLAVRPYFNEDAVALLSLGRADWIDRTNLLSRVVRGTCQEANS